MCELSEALDCENEEIVIRGFTSRYNVSYEEAQDIFNETKKLLWLASKTSGEAIVIDTSLLVLDEMWHTFILHTKQYYDYCMKKFHSFIHHIPTPESEKEKHKQDFEARPEEVKRIYLEKLEQQYNLIYDHLGPDTLIKWYDNMASKYTPQYIQTIKK